MKEVGKKPRAKAASSRPLAGRAGASAPPIDDGVNLSIRGRKCLFGNGRAAGILREFVRAEIAWMIAHSLSARIGELWSLCDR
jgi:hypothetical protein